MFELEEEDLEEEYDYADEMPLDMVAIATHELQDTDYDSPHVDAEEEPETFIRAPIPKRFRKKNKQKMSDISERDQLMDEARKILTIDQQMGVDEDSEPLYGFLMRKTRLSWIQRWCVCSDNSLYISKSPKDHLSVTKVYLPHYSICRSKFDEHKKEWVFKIWGEGKKTIYLAAQNQQSRDHWVQGLREAARSTERTPVNTLTKSTIKQMATSSLTTLKGITLGRERTSSKSVSSLPKSPPDTEVNKASLTSAFEREFPSHGGSQASDDVWLETESGSETVVLSGTLKKSNRRSGDQWDYRHYVVIGSILREYVSGTDEWPQDSVYLPGSKITTTCNSSANPPYVIKIEPIAKAPIILAAKSRLELNVWEQELKALSKLRPDPIILRDMDPDYVDLYQLVGPHMSEEQGVPQRGATVSFGARAYTENSDEKTRSSSMQSGSRNKVHQTPPAPKRGGGKYQRGHRRTHSDNYFNPAELRTPAAPQPRYTAYSEEEKSRTRYASSGSGSRYHHVTPHRDVPPMLPPPNRPVPDVHPMLPPPNRPVPTLPPEPSPTLPPHSPNDSPRPRSRGATLPSRPPNVTMPSRPPVKPPKYKPIVPPQDSTWPYPVPNPLSDQESQYCSPPNDHVFHSAENASPFFRQNRSFTPDKLRNRGTFVYSDSGDTFDPGEPYNRFTAGSQRLGSSGNTLSSTSSRYESSGMLSTQSSRFDSYGNSLSTQSSRFDSFGTSLSTQSSRFKSSEGGGSTGSQRLEGSGSNVSPLSLRFRNPLSDVDPSEPVSPFNRRANTPPGTRFNKSFEREDLDCGQPLFNAAAHKDPINRATRSRHCSADDKPTEGHLEVKETHHWVTRWVSVRGNVVRIKATQEDNTVITSCRMAGWIISSSDEDNKWAILLSKPGSNDEKMMFAAHTRESRDKWIFSLNKCCSNDSLESFRSNSMNGSTITLNTVDKIKDVKEEITFAEYKGYLREKTHMFQWTRRYCFVTKHSLYITLSEENLEPLFEIVLSTISVNPDSELKKPYAFRLISTQIARELFLAAESEEEYDTWLLVLAGKPVPIRDQISHNKAPRSEPAPPAPIPACKMREIAHTKGLLFRLVDGNWICSWCARHHSNLLLYDSENSALPFNSVKLSGADIATDHAHNIYRFLITPSNQDTTLTLGTENITDFERWCASFTMATTIRSRTATGSSSTRGDSFGRKYESSDYCTTSSAERLDNSSQSLPAERFTSGYGSAESLNSVGSGMYENVSKHHSNRNSSEYEDYVNMGHVPPSVPQRQANEMVEEWVDKVQQVEPEYDEHDASQPPDLPEKPRDHVINSKIDNREKLTTREMAANFEEEDEDYAELPPLPESRQPRSEPADKPAEVELVEQQPEPVSVKNSNQSSGSIGFDTSNLLPEVESLELISDREFERMEREILDSADSSERDPSSKVSSSNDLLINQSVDFPFDDLLDQLEELDEPKNLNRLSGNSQQSDMPSEIPTPVSEPESHPSHSSYDIVSQDVSPEEPLEHISEKEILDATENVPSKDRNLRPTSSSPSSSSSSSSSSGTSSSDPPSSTPDDSDKVSETLEDTPKPSHSNVSRLSSLDKLETWDSGLEESLLRTSKILQEATEEHEHRMFPDQLLLKLGSLEDESYKYTDHSAADLPSPVTSSIDSCESPQSDNPPAATKPKAGKPVSKLARPSGLAPPTKLATPSPRTSRNGTLKKCTASRSSDNVSGLPKSRPTSTEGRNSKITSPYGTLPRKKKTVPKQTKLTRSRQNSSEGGIPGPRASPSATSISSPSIGLRKNTSRDSSSGLAAPKKTNTLPRPSRSLARPISGTGLQKPAGLKVPASRETVRSRSSSRESVASSTGDRDSVRRDSGDSATTRSSLSRNNPTERSMRRRLLSTETSKTLTGKRRLSVGTKKIAPEVLRSPSYQNAVSGSDEPSVPKRSTSLRTSGTSSLPGSNSSSPTPRAPAKSRGSTLPTPSSIRSPSRSSAQSPASSVSKLRTVSTSSKTSESRLSRGTEDKTDTPKSILKPPKSETKLPKSGLPAPKSGLKTPSSTGLRKPSSGGIPRPSR